MKKQLLFCGLSIGLFAFVNADQQTSQESPATKFSQPEYPTKQQQSLGADVPSLVKIFCIKLNRTAFENNWKKGSEDLSIDSCVAAKTKDIAGFAQQIGKPELEAIKLVTQCLQKKVEKDVNECVSAHQKSPSPQ